MGKSCLPAGIEPASLGLPVIQRLQVRFLREDNFFALLGFKVVVVLMTLSKASAPVAYRPDSTQTIKHKFYCQSIQNLSRTARVQLSLATGSSKQRLFGHYRTTNNKLAKINLRKKEKEQKRKKKRKIFYPCC